MERMRARSIDTGDEGKASERRRGAHFGHEEVLPPGHLRSSALPSYLFVYEVPMDDI
jgi:hypothetical protein